jgi:hypothetical protein
MDQEERKHFNMELKTTIFSMLIANSQQSVNVDCLIKNVDKIYEYITKDEK